MDSFHRIASRTASAAIGTALTIAAAVALGGRAFAQPQSGSVAGHCLAFDGVDDAVHVLRSTALEPDEITIELWARLDGPQDWNTRLLRKGEYGAYFIAADQDLDERMQILVTKNQPGVRTSAEDTQAHTAYIGTWHHFLGIYTTDHAEFWVDGVHQSTVVHGLGALDHVPLTDLYIGAGLPITLQNEYFAGRIDEVRIWNYPRTPSEIQASWNASLGGAEPGLVAYWRFDEGVGQAVGDSSPFGNHGVLGTSANAEASDPIWMVSDVPLVPGSCAVGNYCVAAINTEGKGAHIGYQGTTSLAANDLVLRVSDGRPYQTGLFFCGRYPTQIPFGEGYLCVTGHQRRLLPVLTLDALGATSRALDFSDPLHPEAIITAGSEWNFQFWYRDPQPVGHGFNLSDALDAHFCP